MKELMSWENTLKLNKHGLTAQLLINDINNISGCRSMQKSTTDITITTDYGGDSTYSMLYHPDNVRNSTSMDELIEWAVADINSDESTMAIYLEVDEDFTPKGTHPVIGISHHTAYNFGFRFPLGSILYNKQTGLLGVNAMINGIPPLKTMQEKYKRSLFNKIEENLIEMVANGYGGLDNGSDRSITAAEIDTIINSDKPHSEKGLLYKNALLATIFDDALGVDFIEATNQIIVIPSTKSPLDVSTTEKNQ